MKPTRSILLAFLGLAVLAITVFLANGLLGGDGGAPDSDSSPKASSGAEPAGAQGAATPSVSAPRTSADAAKSPGSRDAAREEKKAASAAAGKEQGTSAPAVVGRIVDPTGAAVEGASASIALPDGTASASDVTDSAGRFRIEKVPAGTRFELVVDREDFLPLTVPELAVLAGATLDVGERTLSFGARLEGLVVDPQGSPVAGATVSLVVPSFSTSETGSPRQDSMKRTTADDGVFRFSGLKAGECFVSAGAPAHVAAAPSQYRLKEGALLSSVRIVLTPGRVVSGRVVGPDGEPVPGASVRMSGGGAGRFIVLTGDGEGDSGVKTDANGLFEVHEAPNGDCKVSVKADGFARAEMDTTGGTTDLTIALQRTGSIQGTVLDAATGDPVRSFEAWAEPERVGVFVLGGAAKTRFGGGESRRVRVDDAPDGRFRIDGLDPGAYVVRVQAKAAALSKGDSVTVGPSPLVAETIVRLERGGGIIGFVRDDGTSKPVEGATVRAVPSKGGSDADEEVTVFTSGPGLEDSDDIFAAVAGEATTDATGAFSVEDLPAGIYRLVVRHPERARGDLAGIGVSAGAETGPVTVMLGSAGGVEGLVTGMSGEPVAGAQVTARNTKGTSRTAKTDASGYYKIESVTPGSYSVKRESETPGGMRFVSVVRRAGNAGDLPKPEGFAVEVVANQVARVDFSDADLAFITGRVLDGEKPVAGAALQLSAKGAFAMPLMSRTDEEGAFEYERLDPGSYVLEVRVPPDSRSIVNESIELPAGRKVEKEISLPTGAIEGTVLDKLSHDPVDGARVAIESLGEKAPPGVRMQVRMGGGPDGYYTGRDGKFRIPFVSAGKYRLTAAKDGYGQESIEPVQLMDGDDVASNADVQLSPGCSLAGRVVDAATDAPLSQAFIQGTDADGRPLLLAGTAITDADGRFRLTGLRPGSVSLSVFRPEYERWSGSATVAVKGESSITIPMKPDEE